MTSMLSARLCTTRALTRMRRQQGSGLTREAPRHIVYEAKPQPQDHKVPGSEATLHMLGQ